MRIECENCSATYTIDDAQLGDQPIGAQCPYCGHVKVVQKSAGGSPASDLGFGSVEPSSGLGFGDGVPSPAPTSSVDLGSGFDLDPPGLGGGPRSGGPASRGGLGGGPHSGGPASRGGGPHSGGPASREGFGASSDPRSGGGFPGTGAPPPSGPTLFGEDDLRLDGPEHRASGANAADIGFSVGPSSGGQGALSDAGAVCQECGTPLIDEFDKVIGLCELHQQERRGVGDLGAPSGVSAASSWYARLPTGETVGPVPLEDLRDRIRGGEVPLASQFSTDGQRYQPLSGFKELAYLASLGVGGHAGLGARATYAPAGRRLGLGRLLTPVLLLVVLAGVGYLAWVQRADLLKLYQGIVADEEPTGPSRANPLRRYLASWRLAHPDVSGTAREHLRAAEDLHLEDTWSGYERAERAYQRALLLDENDPEAIAGYVENLALWRYPLSSSQEVAVARSALEYAVELDPESGPVRRALGALALAAGDLRNCRAGADAALERSRSDARARLVLAGCYVDGNVQLAIREAELARRARPALRRSDRVLAAAYQRGGRFRSAYRILDDRLRVDPRNAAVHLAYGHLEASLARYGEAEARFRRAASLEGDRQAALLALGELALERRQEGRAIGFFGRAASAHPPTGRRGARLYAEWARAELARRAFGRAERLAEQALKFEPKSVPALLVMSEAALLSGSATTARAYVRRARKERADEPAALVLEGRIDLAEGQVDAGLQKLRTAVKNDPKDARLHAVLAGGYLAADRAAQAYATMRKAVDLDPARADAIRRNTALTVSESALREAIARFERSARDPRNTSVAYAAVALIHHHLGEQEAASRAVERALALDDANVLALIYQSQIALDRGAIGQAERAAKKLLLVERGSALGHLLRARVHALRGREDAAREDFRSALRTNPGLLAAEVELAALDLESEVPEDVAEARQVLERAFTIEPDKLELRRLLRDHEP